MNHAEPYLPALRFHWLTPFYDVAVRLTTRETTFKRRLLEQADLQSGQNVLDVGCGTGTLALRAGRLEPNIRVTGLDADARILALARHKARDVGPTVEFTQGWADRLPFADGSFDRALSSLFFHHLLPAQKVAALSEIFRVLRPGGEVHIADWGRATSPLARRLFFYVQVFDGFPTTRDHVAGRFPQSLADTGFCDVQVRDNLLTMFGTLSLFSGCKPTA